MRLTRRMTTLVGACIVGAMGLVSTVLPAAAIDEQGSIWVSGTGFASTYPCFSGCSVGFNVASAGYVAGTDSAGIPFTLSWSVASAPLTVGVTDYCAQPAIPDPYPEVLGINGQLQVSSQVVFNYDGNIHQGASITAQFGGTQDPLTGPGFTVSSLSVVVQSGATQLSFTVGRPNGAFAVTPTSAALCPTNTSTTLAIAGSLLSVM
jgi:hypothetical protein